MKVSGNISLEALRVKLTVFIESGRFYPEIC